MSERAAETRLANARAALLEHTLAMKTGATITKQSFAQHLQSLAQRCGKFDTGSRLGDERLRSHVAKELKQTFELLRVEDERK